MTLTFRQRSFRPPSFRGINWASPQARNLHRWWPVDFGHKFFEFEAVANQSLSTTPSPTVFNPGFHRDGRVVQFLLTSGNAGETPEDVSTMLTTAEGMVSCWVGMNEAAPSVANVYNGQPLWGESGGWLGLYAANTGGTDAIWFYNFNSNVDAIPVSYQIGSLDHYLWVHTGGTLYGFKNGLLVNSAVSGNTGDALNRHMFFGTIGTDFAYTDFRIYKPVPPNFARIAYEMWHPATRFDLYWQPGRRLHFTAPAGTTNAAFDSDAAATAIFAGASVSAAAMSMGASATMTMRGASTASSAIDADAAATMTLSGAAIGAAAISMDEASTAVFVGEAIAAASAALSIASTSTMTLATASTAAAVISAGAKAEVTLVGASTASSAIDMDSASTLTMIGAATGSAVFSSAEQATMVMEGAVIASGEAAVSISATSSAVFEGIAIGVPAPAAPAPAGGAGGEYLGVRRRRRAIERDLEAEDIEALHFVEAMAPVWARRIRERRLAEFGASTRVYH